MKSDILPKAYIEPASEPVSFHSRIEFQITFVFVPYLRIYAQDGSQRYESFGQYRAEPVVLDAVCHHVLFDFHLHTPVMLLIV